MSPTTETRDRIVDAARDLIFASSYTDVGVAAICERAGVRKGSFYHFFPSKRDLTLAVLERHYMAAKERLLDQAFDPALAPLDRLRRLSELTYQSQRRLQQDSGHVLGCPFGNLATELSTQEEAIRDAVARILRRLATQLADTLAEAVAAGDLPALDVAATAEAMLAYFEGVLLLAKAENDAEVLRRLLPGMVDIRILQASE